MALLASLGNADRFFQLAFAQCARNSGSKLARLFARSVKGQPTVEHDTQRPCRHQEENDDNDTGWPEHVVPHFQKSPVRPAHLQQQKSGDGHFCGHEVGETCDQHNLCFLRPKWPLGPSVPISALNIWTPTLPVLCQRKRRLAFYSWHESPEFGALEEGLIGPYAIVTKRGVPARG